MAGFACAAHYCHMTPFGSDVFAQERWATMQRLATASRRSEAWTRRVRRLVQRDARRPGDDAANGDEAVDFGDVDGGQQTA